MHTNKVNFSAKRLPLTIVLAFAMIFGSFTTAFSNDRDLQYYTAPDKTGINQFEPDKDTDVEYDGFKFRIGASNTMQFQGLTQGGNDQLDTLGLASNFNLPTANLDFDAQIYDGVRMHLRSWVASPGQGPSFHIKGGYIQIDKMEFISEGFMEDLMDNMRIRIGHMDFNYGDAMFRRSDNAQAMHNPFVENYIMDAYTNEIGGEVYYFHNPFFIMGGVTNSRMNQSTVAIDDDEPQDEPTIIGKIGYDQQHNDDFRTRLTGSFLNVNETQSVYLYNGDRAGGRYYNVLGGGARAARFNPDFSAGEMTAFQINPFVKYRGFEFFGVFENASGKQIEEDDTRSFTQLGAELLYRFGQDERFYLGGRYNNVSGELADESEIEIDRINVGGGFFLSNNMLLKAEYVMQNHDGFPEGTARTGDAEFNGVMLEAVVSF